MEENNIQLIKEQIKILKKEILQKEEELDKLLKIINDEGDSTFDIETEETEVL